MQDGIKATEAGYRSAVLMIKLSLAFVGALVVIGLVRGIWLHAEQPRYTHLRIDDAIVYPSTDGMIEVPATEANRYESGLVFMGPNGLRYYVNPSSYRLYPSAAPVTSWWADGVDGQYLLLPTPGRTGKEATLKEDGVPSFRSPRDER